MTPTARTRWIPWTLLLLSGSAAAQGVNVDIGLNSVFPVPSASYAGAAGQAGTWNGVSAKASFPRALLGLSGSPSGVSVSATGGEGDFGYDNAGTVGDDDAMLDDSEDLGMFGGSATWTFSGLANGSYQVYTYAWAPDDSTFRTNVTVTGSGDPLQTVGGAWTGSHVQGVTYARHAVTVSNGTIVVTASTASSPTFAFGSLNGIQIVAAAAAQLVPYCYGDGSGGVCPCSNLGQAGRGCQNSAGTGGASLAGSGNASTSNDTVVLTVTGELPTALTVVMQGDSSISPVIYGDGVRCMAGSLKRLYKKVASAGTAVAPGGSDLSITARSAAMGAPIPIGATRYYTALYRDASASFCPAPSGSTFNASNGLTIHWN